MVVLFLLLVPLVSFLLARSPRGKRDLGRITVIGIAAALLITVWGLAKGAWFGTTVAGLYEVTLFSQFFKVVFLSVSLIVALVSIETAREYPNPTEYYFLLLTATLGMMVVASSTDLITLFIGVETTGLSTYVLAGYAKRSDVAVETATKYFVVGAFSSSLTLYGISLLYGVTGDVTFAGLGHAVSDTGSLSSVTILSVILIAGGLGFKITAAPFHMWAPDVYYGAPDPVSAFLAAGSKKMGFAALFKVLLVALAASKVHWEVALGILAILSMTVGNVVAIRQTSLKRMLAYSSIAQAGYILIAIVVGTQYAVAGGLVHILVHAFMKGGAFLVVAALALWGIADRVDSYKGLAKRSPFLALALTVFLLSMAGIPPFAGFLSKFLLFSSAIYASIDSGLESARYGWMYWLAIAGILNSVVSLYYYARVIRHMYGESAEAPAPAGAPPLPLPRIRLTPAQTAAIGLCLAVIVVVGIWPSYVVDQAMGAAQSLLGSNGLAGGPGAPPAASVTSP